MIMIWNCMRCGEENTTRILYRKVLKLKCGACGVPHIIERPKYIKPISIIIGEEDEV